MLANRMARELKMLATDPPPGVVAWTVGDSTTQLRAQIRVREKWGCASHAVRRGLEGAWAWDAHDCLTQGASG